jgi:hypothetical protein
VIVGLCSSYLEGRLVQGAVRGLLDACELVYVLEGPAGEPLDADVPATELGELELDPRVVAHSGRWRTDARKRQAMLEWAQARHRKQAPDETLWGVIVDADEVLFNGPYLPDWLLRLDYHEQVTPDAEYLGRPMRIVELDGSVAWVRGRLLRLDRIRDYKVSTSVFRTADGATYTGAGNVPDWVDDWARPRSAYFAEKPDGAGPAGVERIPGRMLVQPPIPTEPFLVHRSMLRHPLRSGLRMNEQERRELILAGMPV